MEIITPSSSTLPILNFNKKEEVKQRSKSLGRKKPEEQSTIVNLLKAELISTKNQLKDAQASNQFIQKEKLKIEHDFNLEKIKFQEKYKSVENEKIDRTCELQALKAENRQIFSKLEYFEQHVSELSQQKIEIEVQFEELKQSAERNETSYARTIQALNIELGELHKKKVRQIEKIFASIIQLGSAQEHLKDLIRLSKNDKSCETNINDYISQNLINGVYDILRLLQQANQGNYQQKSRKQANRCHDTTSSIDNETNRDQTQFDASQFLTNLNFDISKLQTRQQNFKKFREQTQQLVKSFYEKQLQQKGYLINELERKLENQFQQQHNELRQKDQETHDLRKQVTQGRQVVTELQKQIERMKEEEIKQVEIDCAKQIKQIKEELVNVQGALQQKVLKYKYQAKELQEKNNIIQNELMQIKMQNEQFRMQMMRQPIQQPIQQTKDDGEIINLTKELFDLQVKQSKYKEKLKEQKFKLRISQQDKDEYENKIKYYKDTLNKQQDIINSLQELNQYQKHLLVSSHSSQMIIQAQQIDIQEQDDELKDQNHQIFNYPSDSQTLMNTSQATEYNNYQENQQQLQVTMGNMSPNKLVEQRSLIMQENQLPIQYIVQDEYNLEQNESEKDLESSQCSENENMEILLQQDRNQKRRENDLSTPENFPSGHGTTAATQLTIDNHQRLLSFNNYQALTNSEKIKQQILTQFKRDSSQKIDIMTTKGGDVSEFILDNSAYINNDETDQETLYGVQINQKLFLEQQLDEQMRQESYQNKAEQNQSQFKLYKDQSNNLEILNQDHALKILEKENAGGINTLSLEDEESNDYSQSRRKKALSRMKLINRKAEYIGRKLKNDTNDENTF